MGVYLMAIKRKSLSDRLRFEVFKRDCFTCQYCGRKAPEAILNADHIIAVANGGTDDLLNLVTSCRECNSGKSDKKLNDSSVVTKSRRQAELSQAKREQTKMLAEWHLSLVGSDDEIDAVNKMLSKLAKSSLSDSGKKKVRSIIRKYGLDRVLKCLVICLEKYDTELAINKLKAVCYYNHLEETDPAESELAKAFFKLKMRWNTTHACWNTKGLMRELRDLGCSVDRQVEHGLSRCYSFSGFNEALINTIEEIRADK